MPITRRAVTAALIAAGAAAVVAGCTATVAGSGSLGVGAGAGAGSASPGTSVAPTGPTGFPSSSSSSPAQGALASQLISAPAGSRHGSSTWANTTSPSVAAFIGYYYQPDEQASETARLQADGITGVAHHLWIDGQVQVDDILLQFDSQTGASTRHSGVIAACGLDAALKRSFANVPGNLAEFYAPKLDQEGNISSRAYAYKNGNTVVELFMFSPKTFDQSLLTRYATAQLDKLP